MGRDLTKEELMKHKEKALFEIGNYIDTLIESSDRRICGKADKLSYWLEDWTKFLDFESDFSPSSLRRYKRGEIIKAHLGYNIGSEEGGLHYCVVIDKQNSKNSPVITVVPLTSVKAKTDLTYLYPGNIYIGNELFTNLNSKISYTDKVLTTRLSELKCSVKGLTLDTPQEQRDQIHAALDVCKRDLDLLNRMRREVSKMKIGSIALVCQIRTISKIRIYDPKTNYDILSGVKLSNEKLDLIDKEILHNFTGGKFQK